MKTPYENNPLIVTINGLKLIFDKAQQVAVFMIVLLGLSTLIGVGAQIVSAVAERAMANAVADESTVELEASFGAVDAPDVVLLIMIMAIVVTGFILVAYYLTAISDYTAARTAAGKSVTLKEAAVAAWQKFGGYLWVMVLSHLKIMAWSLLLIIPGIYKSVRYSLAGVSYFSDPANLRGDRAIQHSNTLTRDGWLTTFASLTFFNFLTGGLIEPLLSVGSKAVLFRQYKELGAQQKPDAHLLSWIGLLLPLGIVLVVGLTVGGMITWIIASGELVK